LKTLELDGRSLSLDLLAPIARDEPVELRLAPSALAAVQRSRDLVERILARGDVVYGLTTGFGRLKSVVIPTADIAELQRNLVLSHCVGSGAPLARSEVRLAQVLRLNSLLRGFSGVRVALVETLARLFNAGFVPEVPEQGSVGASGDLAPLAHMTAAYLGHGRARLGDRTLAARAALSELGEEPLGLEAKEGLALINGTEIMKAVGVANVLRARNLSRAADALAALSLEALLGSARPFAERLQDLKPDEGQRRAAANVRACLEDSAVLASHRGCDRVQDPYSLRCVPQIHGAFKNALAHVGDVLELELNAVTDNPIVDPEREEVTSAGLFHGQSLSMTQDYLGLALCTLANVSERRIEQLVNPDLSRLPAFLTPRPGLHSGLMIAQYAAAALASENKVLAHPASVDTIPTSANQEDHVSMGVTAARKARAILDHGERVLAIEWVCAAQGREFHRDLRAGRGAEAAYEHLRAFVPALAEDRFLHPELEAARARLADRSLVAAVEAAVGPLLA